MTPRRRASGQSPVLITGGAGFIGTNLAHRLLSAGESVLIFDNLSRRGVEKNLRWLQATHGDSLEIQIADTRDFEAVGGAVRRASAVFHFAAQVAVTSSLVDPREDFDINTHGTFNVLEALRETGAPLVFTSTNKVYGALEGIALRRRGDRYEPKEKHIRTCGVSEQQPLSFHSPYGCSKGAADQYVLDYARSYGIPGIVFRMSCIYGPHQHGNEDQGWIAHFLIRALEGESITIYGDGCQVRDVLFVEDLVDAFLLARQSAPSMAGMAFNIGGGVNQTLSLNQLIELIGQLRERAPQAGYADWRIGDQRYYVSDFSRFSAMTGWRPRIGVREGVARLYDYLCSEAMEKPAGAPPFLRWARRCFPPISTWLRCGRLGLSRRGRWRWSMPPCRIL